MVESKTLPEYDEIIGSLADRLEGLSVVHRGVGEAAASLVAANREFANLQLQLGTLLSEGQRALQEIRRLEPASLESSINSQLSLLGSDTNAGLGALYAQLESLEADATAQLSQLLEQSASMNNHIQAQQVKFQQFGKLISVIATGDTPFQTEVLSSIGALQTSLRDSTAILEGINSSFESSMIDIDSKITGIQNQQYVLSGQFDAIHSTATSNLSTSERLAADMSSGFDTIQENNLAEMRKLLRTQGLLLIICIVVLVSVWFRA